MKKALKITLAVFLILVVAAVGTIYGVWHNEIGSFLSFHEIRSRNDENLEGAVYEIDMKGDFYLDEFVAKGGVSNDNELIDFILGHVTKGVIPVSIKAPEIGCASFTATTEAGDSLFARNYDMKKTNLCIVHTSAQNGRHATISTADLSYIGLSVDKNVESLISKVTCLAAVYTPLDGMNDAGVSCGVYMTYQGDDAKVTATNQQTDKPDFTTTTFLRMVLDYADDLDEAIEIAQSYDMHDSADTSFHYMIADASGRSAVLEWVGPTDAEDVDGAKRVLKVHYNDNDAYLGEREAESNFQWVTNFILCENYYNNEEDAKGLDRYDYIYDVLHQTQGVVADEKEAMSLLEAVGRRTWKPNGTTITDHSVIYNLSQKTVYWVPNENFDDPSAWFTYSLK